MFGYTYINGRLFPPGRAKIPVNDRGFLFGDGIFETMRSYRGNVFMFFHHLDRLFYSLKALKFNLNFDKEDIKEAVNRTLTKNRLHKGDAYIKIIVTRGAHQGDFHFSSKYRSSVIVITKKLKPYPTELYCDGVNIISAAISRPALGDSIYVHKLINYFENLFARDHAHSQGAFEAVFLTGDKLVLEGATTNIFMANGNTVYTPPLTQNILPGITRKVVLDLCRENNIRVREKKLHYRDLIAAGEVFLTNSVAEIMPVKKVDIHCVKKPVPGDLTSGLINLYRSAVLKDV